MARRQRQAQHLGHRQVRRLVLLRKESAATTVTPRATPAMFVARADAKIRLHAVTLSVVAAAVMANRTIAIGTASIV